MARRSGSAATYTTTATRRPVVRRNRGGPSSRVGSATIATWRRFDASRPAASDRAARARSDECCLRAVATQPREGLARESTMRWTIAVLGALAFAAAHLTLRAVWPWADAGRT